MLSLESHHTLAVGGVRFPPSRHCFSSSSRVSLSAHGIVASAEVERVLQPWPSSH